jgi:DNA-directed RNA polymerase subunit RPC12/RpoP
MLAAIPVLLLLAISWLGNLAPGAVVVAIPMGLLILLLGVRFFRRIADAPPTSRLEVEDVADLDVYFVCVECRTEFKVEKLGQLQVPRHCGEKMIVERRPRSAAELS